MQELAQILAAFIEQSPAWALIAVSVWFVIYRVWPFLTSTITTLISLMDHSVTELRTMSDVQSATVCALDALADKIDSICDQIPNDHKAGD